MVRTPTQVLYEKTENAVRLRKRLLGKGSQAKVFSLHIKVDLQHAIVNSVVKQYLSPLVPNEDAAEANEEVNNNEELSAEVVVEEDDDDDEVKGDEASLTPDKYHIVREPFEHEAFVLQRLHRAFEQTSGVPAYAWPFPLFLGASESTNEETMQWEKNVYMERCVGDLHHIDRVLPQEDRDEMETMNKWPRGTILRILTVHVLWALHTWRQRPDTFAMVQADLKPDNVFLRAVDPELRHVRLPMQWQHKGKGDGDDGVVDELVLPNIGLFAIVGDYGCSTLYERASQDEPWTRHSEESENKYGVLRARDSDGNDEPGNVWEDWGVHPEKICPQEPHRNSYDLDFFLNLVTRMMHSEGESESEHELVALSEQLRACIEPPATFSNDAGFYEMKNGSLDFASHVRLGETLEDRSSSLYPLRARSDVAAIREGDPFFRADVERPTSLSYATPEHVLRTVFPSLIRTRANHSPQRFPALGMHPTLAAATAAVATTKTRLHIQDMWEPDEDEEQKDE